MLAARLHAVGEPLTLEDVPLPEPAGTQVRVRVAGCGVCRTDLHIASGLQPRVELPITLGHEVSGWIDSWGPDAEPILSGAGLDAGDAVLVFGGWGCGACGQCLAGQEQRCPTGRSPGFQEDGGYAEAILVPHPRHLVPLGDLDPVRAAPLADAGLTPYRAVRRAAPWLGAGAQAVLIGFGGLGQFALQYLRRLPDVRVAVWDLDPAKVQLASQMGADAAILGADDERSRGKLGSSADVVFDLVGTDDTLARAERLVARGGLIMLVGEGGGHLRFGVDVTAIESWFTTTVWGSLEELRDVVALARDGALHWDVETLPLAGAASAHARLAAGQVAGRLLVVPTGTVLLRDE